MFGQASLLRRGGARRRSRPVNVPAPVGGLNLRDALASMPALDASVLDNWIPGNGSVEVREGNSSYATGLGAVVETLLVYNAPDGSSEMFGAADDEIFDVSSTGAVGAAVVGSLGNARWQYINFGTAGGHFLLAVNAEDTGRQYNGTTWSTFTVTGVNTNTIAHIHSFKERVFLIEEDSMSFWYMDNVKAITGDASEYPLYSFCNLGGYLVAMGTLTRDGGDGMEDLAVFITSEGEVLIFWGTDPGVAATWILQGVYTIGKPIGRRCMLQVGADLVVITEDGFIKLSEVLAQGRASPQYYLSDKIRDGVSERVRAFRGIFGWQPLLFPDKQIGIFNCPTREGTNASAIQFVVNLTTGSWCRFTGWDAACFAHYDDELYFGGTGGVVYKALTGFEDNGAAITADAQQAYSYFGSETAIKHAHAVFPRLLSEGELNLGLQVNVDYEDDIPEVDVSLTISPGAAWDDAVWDESEWGGSESLVTGWQNVAAVGTAMALRLRTKTLVQGVRWADTSWLFEDGGLI